MTLLDRVSVSNLHVEARMKVKPEDYGYRYSAGSPRSTEIDIPDDYDLLRPGIDIRAAGDEWCDLGKWYVVGGLGLLISNKIEPDWAPHRRRKALTKASSESKWSCSHGRDPGQAYCVVCAVFHRYVYE